MAGFQFNPQPVTPQSLQFGMAPTQGGTLPYGYGALPATGAGTPAYAGIGTNMNGFYTPPAYSGIGSNWAGAPSDMGGRGALNAPTSLAGSGFGFNMGTAQLGLDGLKTIGGLYNAFQSNKLANESFEFSKRFAEKNLSNQTQSYNDRMADTLNSRGFTTGRAQTETDAEINRRKLTA